MLLQNVYNNVKNSFGTKYFFYIWIGYTVSTIGYHIQLTGQSWLVFSLTNSSFLVSLVYFVEKVVILFISIVVGGILDRLSKRKVLIITQAIAAILSLIIGLLIFLKIEQFWHILAYSFIYGILNALFFPAENLYISEIVEQRQLTSAVSLFNTVSQAGRFIGTSLSAVSIYFLTVSGGYFINSICYLVFIFFIALTKPTYKDIKHVAQEVKASFSENLKDGLYYVRNNQQITHDLLMLGVISMFAMNYDILVLAMSKSIFKMDAKSYGILMASFTTGSFFGSILLVLRSSQKNTNIIAVIIPYMIAIFLLIEGVNTSYTLMLPMLFISGFFNTLFLISVTSNLLELPDKQHKSHVMGYYMFMYLGISPFGKILVGKLIDIFGCSYGFLVSGVVILILISLINWMRWSCNLKEKI